MQLLDRRGVESGPPEALAVDAVGRGGVAARRHVGRNVLEHHRPHGGERVPADRAELVHDGERAKHHEVVDGHVAGEGRAVGHHRARADLAVVRDVHVGHDPVVVADPGDSAPARRPAVEGAVLADDVAVADLEPGRAPVVLLVLGVAADGHEGMEVVVGAEAGRPLHHRVRVDAGAVAHLHVVSHHRIGAHHDFGAEPRPGRDDRRRMNQLPRSAPISSAVATTSPSTRASASTFQIPRELCRRRMSTTSWSPGTTGLRNRALSTPTM